ncbi:ATP cone domain-containing protein [Methanobacterium sp. ACI-7]|uniref:ATP cone domain-containing protein n=1 Tax=unclassified Methanobacterium TaxID=2627676 RepID=UPI0039C1D2DC
MTDVIKRNGQKEQFKEEKLRMSIEGAVRDAGMDISQKREVIDHAAQDAIQMSRGMDQVDVKQIRDTVLRDLEQDDQQVAQAWRNYERTHGMKY